MELVVGEYTPRIHGVWAGIALLVAFVGGIGLLSAFAPWGSGGSHLRTAVAIGIAATTIPVTAVMLRYPLRVTWVGDPHAPRANIAFLAYADVGIVGVLATFGQPRTALYGCFLLTLVSIYSGFFVPRKLCVAHLVVASAAIVYFAYGVLDSGLPDDDLSSVMVRGLTCLAVVDGALILLLALVERMQHALLSQDRQAHRDSLTGLLNRRGLYREAMALIQRGDGVRLRLMLVDIDGFKLVNDSRGHAAGDHALVAVANRLRRTNVPDAVVGRLGGDEFVLVVHDVDDWAGDEAARIQRAIRDAAEVDATVSVGISMPIDATTPGVHDEAKAAFARGLRQADEALYRAKASGGDAIVIDGE